jgi:hypothetical protein
MKSFSHLFRPLLLALLLITATGCASGPPAPAGEPISLRVAPGGIEEHCLRLSVGEAIRYRFSASAPVEFNIHVHRGKDVLYPVRLAGVSIIDARFVADANDDYCLMWENPGREAAALSGSVVR